MMFLLPFNVFFYYTHTMPPASHCYIKSKKPPSGEPKEGLRCVFNLKGMRDRLHHSAHSATHSTAHWRHSWFVFFFVN